MMNSEQAAIGVAITRTRYDDEAGCVVIETIEPHDVYADEPVDAINAQVNAIMAGGPLAVIDKIDPVKLERHKRLVAEHRRVGRVDVTVYDESAEISQKAWDKLEMMRGEIDRDVVKRIIALAPPETEKPRKLHEDMTLDDWRRGIANSSRQYHGT